MIYCVIGKALGSTIMQAFPEDDRIAVGDEAWLVWSSASTSKLAWKHIVSHWSGAASSEPSGIVLPVHGYFGRRPSSVWEWIAAKREVGNDL